MDSGTGRLETLGLMWVLRPERLALLALMEGLVPKTRMGLGLLSTLLSNPQGS
jgi:hypothetical protein